MMVPKKKSRGPERPDDAIVRDVSLTGLGVFRVKARNTKELLEKIRELREALK
jgi:hypothetical protein